MSVRLLLATCVTLAVATTASFAQTMNFVCPKAGTVEERGSYIFKYNGASAADPVVCQRLDASGNPELRLFNLYVLGDRINTAAANSAVKAGMSDLLSGRKTTVSFPYTSVTGYVETDTWTFLRKEPYTVGGKSFDTMVFDVDLVADSRGRAQYHGHYVRWLDPKTGLWLKAERNVLSGQGNSYPGSYRVTAMTLP